MNKKHVRKKKKTYYFCVFFNIIYVLNTSLEQILLIRFVAKNEINYMYFFLIMLTNLFMKKSLLVSLLIY